MKFILLSSAAAVLTLSVPAHAQTTAPAPEASDSLDDIVVTAQRRKERLQATPAAISAFDQRALDTFNIGNSRDMIGSVPNLYQGRVSTAPSTQTYGLRGLGQTDKVGDPTVAIYLDDVYLPRSLGILFDVPGLERVEVLRGPQGTLYGRNATAGAIRYITQVPGPETQIRASLGYGNFNQIEASGLISGQVANDVYLSVAAVHRERDGYTYNATTKTYVNNLNSTAGRIALRVTPTDRLELKFNIDGVYDYSDTTVYVPNTPPAGQVHDPYVTYEGPAFYYQKGGNPKSKLTSIGGSFSAQYRFDGDMALKFISAFRGFGGPYDNENDGLPQLSATYIKYREREQTNELQFTGSAGRLHWTSGLFYFHESYQLNPIINTGTRTLAYPSLTTNSYAAYGQLDYALTDTLSFTAGARYSHETRSFSNRSYRTDAQFDPTTLIYSSNAKKGYSSFDPKLGVRYTPTSDLMFYASYARGFQAGGYSIRAASATIAQAPYEPQTADSYEVGVKAEWFDRRLRTNISVFQNNVKSFQASAYDPQINASRILNAGAAVTRGFEVELATTPFKGFELSSSLGYTDAYYTRFDNPFGPGTSGLGKKLVFAPDWVGSISGNYTVPLAIPGRVTLAAQLQYTGRTFVDVVNTPGAEAPPQTFVNGSIAYKLPGDHLQVKLSATNLFDIARRQFTFSIPGVSASSYNPPRMVLAQISYTY